MVMFTLLRLVFLFSVTGSLLVGEVMRSPFLPPGYENRPKPTDVIPPKPVARPVVQNVKITNEIEFRGYFSLGAEEKRKLCFSLFNKKLNRGEWVSLGEKTAEDFEVAAFDMDSETLTVSYGGSTAEMSLYVSKGSPSSPSRAGGAPKALAYSSAVPSATGATGTSAGKPRVMPPRPKNRPTLPPWLAARASSGSSPAAGSSSARLRNVTSSGGGFPVPASLMPPFASPPSPGPALPPGGTGGSSTGHVLAPVRLAPSTSSPSTSTLPASASSSGSIATAPPEGADGDLDLENLPPPPPPPDILPPGPPPNIQPSRD